MTRRSATPLVLIAAFVWAVTASPRAQAPEGGAPQQEPTVTFKSGVELVTVTAAVRDRRGRIIGTFGVSRLIMEGDRPKPVPPGIVEELLAMTEANGLLSLDGKMRCGQQVRVLSGPFAGALGTLVKLTSVERVQILLDIMGRGLRLSLERKALAPMSV